MKQLYYKYKIKKLVKNTPKTFQEWSLRKERLNADGLTQVKLALVLRRAAKGDTQF